MYLENLITKCKKVVILSISIMVLILVSLPTNVVYAAPLEEKNIESWIYQRNFQIKNKYAKKEVLKENEKVVKNANETPSLPQNFSEKTSAINPIDKTRNDLGVSYNTTNVLYFEALENIRNNSIDFSSITIACLGDSITYGANSGGDSAKGITYEDVIKEALHTKEVLNYGIGGSSISTYWDKAMCERYIDIPQDTNVILVLGGINDCFAMDEVAFGTIDALEPNTFCGDLNILMNGLKTNYPNSEVIFVTPMASGFVSELRNQEEYSYIVNEEKYASAINALATNYGFNVIDLYHSNFLNSYDDLIVQSYVQDKVHPNDDGYLLLGTYLASEIINIIG